MLIVNEKTSTQMLCGNTSVNYLATITNILKNSVILNIIMLTSKYFYDNKYWL